MPQKLQLDRKNLTLFWKYIAERHRVYKKRKAGEAKPWSKDTILQTYKFTNVFRFLDPGTKFVTEDIQNFVTKSKKKSPKRVFEDYIFNVIYYRIYNKIATVRYAGLLDFEKFDKEKLLAKLLELRDEKHAVPFTNAFTVSTFHFYSHLPSDKVVRSVHCLSEIHKMLKANKKKIFNELWKRRGQADSSEFLFQTLLSFRGIGNFLGYQMAVDIGYRYPDLYNESTHVVAGPGCERGLKRLFKNPGSLNAHQQMQWLVDNQEKGFKKIGVDVDELFDDQDKDHKRLNLMAIENCLCEISKYLKAKYAEGRPRNKYPGVPVGMAKPVIKVSKNASKKRTATSTRKVKRKKR